MKKYLALILALVMVLSAVSALAEAAFTPAESYDPGERAFDGGVINLVPAAGGSGNTVYDILNQLMSAKRTEGLTALYDQNEARFKESIDEIISVFNESN